MATLVSAPALPIPGQACKVTFSGLDSATNFIRLFPVSAPIDSKLREGIDAAKGELAEIHSGPSSRAWDFTPDKGGVYTFKLDESTIRPASGAQFEDDPSGSPLPTPTASSTVVLYVGQSLQMTLGQSPDEVTLRLYVWNDTVRATTFAIHGEDTPALIDPTSPLAENASYDGDVLDAVGELANLTAAAISGTLSDDFETLRGWYMSIHRLGTEHANADDVNVLSTGWTASNKKAAEEAINQLRSVIDGHTKQLVNSAEAEVHAVIDGATSFFSGGASDETNVQFFALADACVRLIDHAALSAPHDNVAPVGTVDELGPLTQLCARYIEALKLQTPTIPTAKNPGVAVLSQLAGFTEA